MKNKGLLVVVALLAIAWFILKGLGSALSPLLFAFCLAYLLFPIILRIEKLGIKRYITVSLFFVVFILLSTTFFALLIPNLITETSDFLQELPQTATALIDRIKSLASDYGYELTINSESVKKFVIEHTAEISGPLAKGLSAIVKIIFPNALRWLLGLLNLFLIPLFFFYLINDYEKIIQHLQSYVPPSWRPRITHYIEMSNDVLKGYIRGQLIVAGILSMLYGFGLLLVGVRFGFLIGFISGWLSLIPYAGFTIGLLTSLGVALAHQAGLATFIGIGIVFGLTQTLEGTIITPRLVGNKVGLSALTTMLCLIAGGNLAGVLGMLVAIPCTAVLKNMIVELSKEYRKLEIYK